MRYLFDGFELDDERFELRDATGGAVTIRRQAVDVLLYLVRARGRVVGKGELVEAIWAGSTVSETALPQAVRAIRRALGDEIEGSRFIQTVRGRGYQLVAPVEERAEPLRPPQAVPQKLVGRARSIALLEGMLDEAAGGRGGVALLSGDAGAGRTRVATELAAAARARGFTVHVARCDEASQAPELWPWTQIVRAALGDAAPAAPLALDGVVPLLSDAARAAPLLVVLDDIDAADVASLLVLKRAARGLRDVRALALATYRDASLGGSSPLARTVGALVRDEPSRHVTLAPLGESDVAAVAEATLGGPPDAALLGRLVEKTGGNALLLAQMLHVMQKGDAAPDASTSRLLAADETREAIALPLADFSTECRAMLDAASVLGATFALPVLSSMMGEAAPRVLELIDEASAARVIARDDGGRFRFRHALLRDVVYAKLRASRRVTLHDRAAQALDAAGDATEARAHRSRVRALLGET